MGPGGMQSDIMMRMLFAMMDGTRRDCVTAVAAGNSWPTRGFSGPKTSTFPGSPASRKKSASPTRRKGAIITGEEWLYAVRS